MCSLDSLDHCQTVDTLVIRLGESWLMVAETCSGNWIKVAMVCSSKCKFGRFFREDFSCIKKTIFFYNFP